MVLGELVETTAGKWITHPCVCGLYDCDNHGRAGLAKGV